MLLNLANSQYTTKTMFIYLLTKYQVEYKCFQLIALGLSEIWKVLGYLKLEKESFTWNRIPSLCTRLTHMIRLFAKEKYGMKTFLLRVLCSCGKGYVCTYVHICVHPTIFPTQFAFQWKFVRTSWILLKSVKV